MPDLHYEMIAVFIVRVFLGLLFLFQGYDAVFRIKIKGVVDTILAPLKEKGLPNVLIYLGAYFTSYVELICGFLLIIGFLKYYALCLLGIDLLLAASAFGMLKPMWDMQFLFPRLVLLIFLLVVPSHWDMASMDMWLFRL